MGSSQTREVREFEKVDSPVAEGMLRIITFLVLAVVAPFCYFFANPQWREDFGLKQAGMLILYEFVVILVLLLLLIFGLDKARQIPQRVQKIRLEGSTDTVIDAMAALKLSGGLGFLPSVPKPAAFKQ